MYKYVSLYYTSRYVRGTQQENSVNTYMIVARFKPGTEMKDIYAVRDAEMERLEVLRTEGRCGSLHVSMPKQTVFLEVFAQDEGGAQETVESLPMAKLWTVEVYPTPTPPPAGTQMK